MQATTSKVWLITGASRDLGRAFTEAALEAGPQVVATARNTDWLNRCVVLDNNGFIKTGPDLSSEDLMEAHWPLSRRPLFA
jgi:NAD(P)-dependent dehydrogenase (short-subunit alcohol dehydrogenase family)